MNVLTNICATDWAKVDILYHLWWQPIGLYPAVKTACQFFIPLLLNAYDIYDNLKVITLDCIFNGQ